MKVAIVTITDGQNYGNRLQNYALQEVLVYLGHEVCTFKRKTFHDKSPYANVIQWAKKIIKRILGRPYGRHRDYRRRKFDAWNRQFMRFSDVCLHDNVAPDNLSDKYDFFIVGSDQVWNAGFRIISEDLHNYLLDFALPKQRVSYAASFGTDKLAEGVEELFQVSLPQFKAISVREQSGIDIVRSCNANAVVTLDPVMLLSTDKWTSISKKPRYADDQPFVVTYFLGRRDELIDDYCTRLIGDMKGYHLDFEYCPESKVNIEEFATAPDEFIWLIANAEYILTDSFHAVAFSILFHKPFWVFDRKAINDSYKMGGRITTLLSTFGLMDHRRLFTDPIERPKPIDIESETIDEVLLTERQRSLHFLTKALAE